MANLISKISVAVCLTLGPSLAGCASRSEPPPVAALGEDDDAFCRAKGLAVGSAEYVACRKDRDVVRGNAAARADRAQRNLGEMMLNRPETGPRSGF